MTNNSHIIQSAASNRSTSILKRILLVACFVLMSGVATSEVIPVQFFVSPNDNGAGGSARIVRPNAGQLTLAVWSNFQGAGGGSGAISVQDVLFRATGGIGIVGFTCALTDCIVGNRSDPRTVLPFPSKELIFTAGDDTAVSPTLTGLRKIGDLVINVGAESGELTLIGGTALDGNSAHGPLEIAALPNEGKLLVPEPAQALQIGFAIATLIWLRRRAAG